MITEKQREERLRGIGSSDAAAILGADPFRSPYDVWMEKTGRAQGFEGNAATWLGDKLESAVREALADQLAVKIVQPTSTMIAANGIMRANLDGMIDTFKKGQPVVEIKTTSRGDDWGDPGTDQIPDRVLVQVTHQMICAESSEAVIGVLTGDIRGLRFNSYYVPLDPDFAAIVEAGCIRFWQDYVMSDTPPPLNKATDLTIKNLSDLERSSSDPVEVDLALVQDYLEATRLSSECDEAKKLARARIMAAMSDSRVGVAGPHTIKISKVSTSRFSSSMLKKDDPDLYQKYVTQSSHERMTISGG